MDKKDNSMDMGKRAKMDNLMELRKMAMSMIKQNSDMPEESEEMPGKVMVAAKNPEGLSEGLSKAKELVDSQGGEDEEMSMDPESEESDEDSDESLMAQLEALKAKIASRK